MEEDIEGTFYIFDGRIVSERHEGREEGEKGMAKLGRGKEGLEGETADKERRKTTRKSYKGKVDSMRRDEEKWI